MITAARRRWLVCERLDDRIAPANLALTGLELLDGFQNPQPSVVYGQQLQIRASGVAEGLSQAVNAEVRVTVHGIPLETTVALTPGDTAWSVVLGGWYAETAAFTVSAMIDPQNLIAETNETDNFGTKSIAPMQPATLPGGFVLPLGRGSFKDWAVTQYVDVDPRPGVVRDALGGSYAYDGHAGWDANPFRQDGMDRGFPIFAAAEGVVTLTQDGYFDRNTAGSAEPGNMVVIDHGNNWRTLYGHLAQFSLTVAVGDSVKPGQLIGLMGSSGNSTGAHLHFEVQHRGLPVETLFAPAHYWKQPPPYAGAVSPFAFDAYVTNQNPFTDAAEKPSTIDTFALGQNGTIYFPVEVFNAKTPLAAAELKWRIFRPDGTQFASAVHTPSSLSKQGLWSLSYPLSTFTGTLGTWQYSFELNGTEVRRVPFNVTLTGAAALRLSQGTELIAEGRTTPVDFGTAMAGNTAPQRSFTIQNHGAAALLITDVKTPAGFSVHGLSPLLVAAGGSATLTLKMDTNGVGEQFGQVAIATNDPQTPVYRFNVSGNVIGAIPVGTPVISLGGKSTAYNHKSAPRLVAPAATLGGGLSISAVLGSLTAEIASGGDGQDVLGIRHQGFGPGQVGVLGTIVSYGGTAIGTVTGGTLGLPLTVTFTSLLATPDAVQAVMRNVTYRHADADPINNRRYIRFTVADALGNKGNQPIAHVIPSGVERAPVLAPVAGGSVQAGTVFSRTGTFTDPHGTSWIGTVDYGDGSGSQPLTISPNGLYTLTHTYPTPGNYDINVRIVNDQGGTGDGGIAMAVAPPPNVYYFTVNSGAAQRSRLTTIDVHFFEPVDAEIFQIEGGIRLERTDASGGQSHGTVVETGATGGSGRILVSPATGMTNSISLSFDNADGSPASSGVESGSLTDGRWQLFIDSQFFASEIDDPMLRRLFGDVNNDGTVDASDFAAFGASFAAGPGSAFDFDHNGTVDSIDFAQFGGRFGLSL